jgi:hypothetical protein
MLLSRFTSRYVPKSSQRSRVWARPSGVDGGEGRKYVVCRESGASTSMSSSPVASGSNACSVLAGTIAGLRPAKEEARSSGRSWPRTGAPRLLFVGDSPALDEIRDRPERFDGDPTARIAAGETMRGARAGAALRTRFGRGSSVPSCESEPGGEAGASSFSTSVRRFLLCDTGLDEGAVSVMARPRATCVGRWRAMTVVEDADGGEERSLCGELMSTSSGGGLEVERTSSMSMTLLSSDRKVAAWMRRRNFLGDSPWDRTGGIRPCETHESDDDAERKGSPVGDVAMEVNGDSAEESAEVRPTVLCSEPY